MKFHQKSLHIFAICFSLILLFVECAGTGSYSSKSQEISAKQRQGKSKNKVDCPLKEDKQFKAKVKQIKTHQQKRDKVFAQKKKSKKKPKIVTMFAWENPWISTYKIKKQKNKEYK